SSERLSRIAAYCSLLQFLARSALAAPAFPRRDPRTERRRNGDRPRVSISSAQNRRPFWPAAFRVTWLREYRPFVFSLGLLLFDGFQSPFMMFCNAAVTNRE